MKEIHIEAMNSSIITLMNNARRISMLRPSMVPFVVKTALWQKKAAASRMASRKEGVHVPPFVIFSITDRCNLTCTGCYAQHFAAPGEELSSLRMDEIIGECQELGVSLILLAGGEPLARPEILSITSKYPRVVFPLFTNGILLKDDILDLVEEQKNLIPIISIEGEGTRTDIRRGSGVFHEVLNSMKRLQSRNKFFGISITVTEENFETVTDGEFIGEYEERGCGLFFYVEYVPVNGDSQLKPITMKQRIRLEAELEGKKQMGRSLFISFPGDESKFGGCLSSGRGFVHINPRGSLEPCPFSPFSDINLKDVSFRAALESPLLKQIRSAPENMKDVEGGCALWKNREWVQTLIKV